MTDKKVYVDVVAAFDRGGKIRPLSIRWEDGTTYEIDKLLDVRSTAAMKAGGHGDRYTVTISGREKYLFFERNTSSSGNNTGRWFVERK